MLSTPQNISRFALTLLAHTFSSLESLTMPFSVKRRRHDLSWLATLHLFKPGDPS